MANFELKNNLIQCNSNIVDGNYNTSANYTFNITANNGYDFLNNTPYIIIRDNRGNYNEKNFVRISDTEFELNYKVSDNVTYIILNGVATQSNNIKNKYGLISVYNPTINEIKTISENRFIKFNNEMQYIDTTQYIVSLIKLYCNVKTGNKEKVYFGKYDMNVESNVVLDDLITLDCGSVNVNEKFHNSLDYTNTQLEIYLPFIGFNTLNIESFMNNELHLKYEVNVINGESLAILSVNNNAICTYSCNISFNIPYTMENYHKVITDITPNTNYLNNISPFVYIKRPILISIPPRNKSNIYDILLNYEGYIEVSNLKFSIIHNYITNTEIEEIKNLLNQGVIL